jgi:hypothetical protein
VISIDHLVYERGVRRLENAGPRLLSVKEAERIACLAVICVEWMVTRNEGKVIDLATFAIAVGPLLTDLKANCRDGSAVVGEPVTLALFKVLNCHLILLRIYPFGINILPH